jgi:xylulokinase
VRGLLLGVDVGTSSTKGVLARPDGGSVAAARRDHDLSLPRPGWAEHDVEGIRWSDLASLYRELCPATKKQIHGLAGLQKGGVCVVV